MCTKNKEKLDKIIEEYGDYDSIFVVAEEIMLRKFENVVLNIDKRYKDGVFVSGFKYNP